MDHTSPFFSYVGVGLKMRATPLSTGEPLSLQVGYTTLERNPPPELLPLVLPATDAWVAAPTCPISSPQNCLDGAWYLTAFEGDDPLGYYVEMFVDSFPLIPVGSSPPPSSHSGHRPVESRRFLYEQPEKQIRAAGDCSGGPPERLLAVPGAGRNLNDILVGNLQPSAFSDGTARFDGLVLVVEQEATKRPQFRPNLTMYASSLDTQQSLNFCVAYRYRNASNEQQTVSISYIELGHAYWTNNLAGCPEWVDISDCANMGQFVLWAFENTGPTKQGFDTLFVIDAGVFQPTTVSDDAGLPVDCSQGIPTGPGAEYTDLPLGTTPLNSLFVGTLYPDQFGPGGPVLLYDGGLSATVARTSFVLTASANDTVAPLTFCVAWWPNGSSSPIGIPAISVTVPQGDWMAIMPTTGSTNGAWALWGFQGNSTAGYVVESFRDHEIYNPAKLVELGHAKQTE